MVGACRAPAAPLQRLIEARGLAADASVQFTRAADAANRAVMADTDDGSVSFAREAARAAASVQTDVERLASIFGELGYSNETRLLDDFRARFTEYRSLDKAVLELAVENTNLKAQRLSFGPSQAAVDALRTALDGLSAQGGGDQKWRVEALVANVMAAVREIQVLQAPHIAEADEAAMTRLEKQMATAETTARTALASLATLVDASRQSQLAAATDALDRFKTLNDEIVALSRRNTNVRSLAMSLGQKRMLTAACEESLRALQDALDARTFAATR
jgi:hypothetical protein